MVRTGTAASVSASPLHLWLVVGPPARKKASMIQRRHRTRRARRHSIILSCGVGLLGPRATLRKAALMAGGRLSTAVGVASRAPEKFPSPAGLKKSLAPSGRKAGPETTKISETHTIEMEYDATHKTLVCLRASGAERQTTGYKP